MSASATAERSIGIDGVSCNVPSLPMTGAALRAFFPDRIPPHRALWRADGTAERPVLSEVRDDDLVDPPGWLELFTARRDLVEAPAGDPALLAEAFAPGTRFRTRRGVARAMPWVSGWFSSGKHRVVACDPNLVSGARPFEATLPRGMFSVRVAQAAFEDPAIGLRNTYAGIFPRVPPWSIDRWQPATPAGAPAPWRYPVDYAMGAFMTEKLAAGLARGGPRYERLTRKLATRAQRVWFESFGTSTVAAFDTGLGDGRYASYWGLDAAGAIVALVTDFELLGA